MQSQKTIWNKIAQEWHEFKIKPSKRVLEFLEKKKGKILDLGSGSARNIVGLKSDAEFYFTDFSKQMLKLAEQRTKKQKIKSQFILTDISKLPFENNFFDSAICISALHCIKGKPNRTKAIQELYRVLKPKAQAYIGVWNIYSKRFKNSKKEKLISWRNKGKRYYYLHSEEEIYKQFQEAGFKIIKKQNSEMMINFIVKK